MSLTTVDQGMLSANAQFIGFKNRLIDAGFIINQRGYTSGTSLSSGSYGHDRWKGGGSGGTYTFTQGSTGVPIVVTITAGSIQQVIEGCNVPEGGTYVLSWTGTAQGRFNGGTYGASPLAVTGVTAGANLTIEFNTGTLSYPQLEKGSTATSFDYRPYGTELALCQRYYQKSYGQTVVAGTISSEGRIDQASTGGTNRPVVSVRFTQPMRIPPTVTFYSPATGASGKCRNDNSGTDVTTGSYGAGETGIVWYPSATTTASDAFSVQFTASSEL